MFHGGGPPGGRCPRPYEHRKVLLPTPFNQPLGPGMAAGFRPQGQYNTGPYPVPGPIVQHQYEGSGFAFPPFYLGNQGPCGGGPPGESIGRELNPGAVFPVVSTGNSLSQQDMENERASEEFLRCLAAKEKFVVHDRAVDRGDLHYRPPCPGNGQRQELGADDQACKRQSVGRSKSRPRSRGKSKGRSKSRPRSRSQSQGKSNGRSKSRPRSRSQGKSIGRSKSRPRSRSRGKSMGRSKSRPRSRSRGKSMGRSKSRPRSRSQGKSMGRSKSRPRSRSRSRGKSMGLSKSRPQSRSRSRGKSMVRSKSRPRSHSRSRSRGKTVGRSKSRHRTRSREKSLTRTCHQGPGRGPSQSCSGSSSSSSITREGTGRTAPPSKKSAMDVFRELLLAGHLKNREELLALSKMAALKNQLDPTSRYSCNISGEYLPRETHILPSTRNQGTEPSPLASIPGQAREQPHGQRVQAVRGYIKTGRCVGDFGIGNRETGEESGGEFLLPHERVRHDTDGFSRILGTLGNAPDPQEKRKIFGEIKGEEKFLYGEAEDKGKASVEVKAAGAGEKQQAAVDFEKIKKALTTIGLDLGKAEISKMMARSQEHQSPRVTESPRPLKGVSPSGGSSPSQGLGPKRNRSPNSDALPNSHPPTKQAPYGGTPIGAVRAEFNASAQGMQAGDIPFFGLDPMQQPATTAIASTSALGSKPAVWGQTPLNAAKFWLQKQNQPATPASDGHFQIPGLGSLKEALESLNATTKGSGMELANHDAYGRTSQRQNHSEDNGKVKAEALGTDVREKTRRKDYLLRELESLLKQEVSEFVVPVIGYCCQLCEEFSGDVASAQDHAECWSHKEKYQKLARGCKSEANPLARPTVDTERRELRKYEHKWMSKEDPKGYRETGEWVSVKEEKPETARHVRAVPGPCSAVPPRAAERKDSESSRSSVSDSSSRAHKKKKKKKEKKRLKKEKKEKKREKKEKG